jgi:glucokinase
MSKTLAQRRNENTRKAGVLLVGGVIGALTGVGAAYLLWQAKERRSVITSGGAVKLGVMLFGLLRQINELARGK